MAFSQLQWNGTAVNAIAYPGNVTAGSLLIACAEVDGALNPAASITDTRGNSWSLIHTALTTSNGQKFFWWWAVSKDAGACTVTMTNTASFKGYMVAEFSPGGTGTISLDAEDTVYRTTTGAAVDKFSTATVTASADNSLAIGFLGTDTNANDDITAGSGCSFDGLADLDGAASDFVAMEHKTVNTGSVALPWTTVAVAHNGDFSGQVFVAVFKFVADAPAATFVVPHRIGR